jgi:hypothetical protein
MRIKVAKTTEPKATKTEKFPRTDTKERPTSAMKPTIADPVAVKPRVKKPPKDPKDPKEPQEQVPETLTASPTTTSLGPKSRKKPKPESAKGERVSTDTEERC